MTDDLVSFLRARLDEDEDYARTMTAVGERKVAAATPRDLGDAYSLAMTVLDDPDAMRIIGRWADSAVPPPNDLKRVRRQVEAVRAILGAYESQRAARFNDAAVVDELRDVTQTLASVYSDHPDYRPEWKF